MIGMADWKTEIVELHQFFEDYFLGRVDDLARVDQALADDFTIVGPNGVESSRAETVEDITGAHAHTRSLSITVTEPRLLLETDEVVVASYIENHQLSDRTNHRLSTVVFCKDSAGPNGLRWQRVHETWVDRVSVKARRATC